MRTVCRHLLILALTLQKSLSCTTYTSELFYQVHPRFSCESCTVDKHNHRVHYRSLDTSSSQTELPNQDVRTVLFGRDDHPDHWGGFLILVRDLGECVMLMPLLSVRERLCGSSSLDSFASLNLKTATAVCFSI
jgi:hypothetical protein